MSCSRSFGALFATLFLSTTSVMAERLPLIRFPTLSQDHIYFVARGKLWVAPAGGGASSVLVDGPGQVLFPHVSPDGRLVAFTWRKQGLTDVYVVSAQGGTPVALTHGPSLSPYDNAVTGWAPNGDVVFVSQRALYLRGEFDTYQVPPNGGLAVPLGLGHSGTSSYAPDGETITYDNSFRNFIGDRWKRYRGGQVSKLVSYNTITHNYKKVTAWEGIDTFPMWWRGSLYFLSDRGTEHRLNLWRKDPSGFTQITHYDKFDIDAPSVGPGGIAFQVGGDVVTIREPDAAPAPITLVLPTSDTEHSLTPSADLHVVDVSGHPMFSVDSAQKTVWMVAAGRIFRKSARQSATDVTGWPGSASSYPSISPDHRQLAFVSDVTGQEQLMVMPTDGGKPQALTHFASGVLYTPQWSPNGQGLIIADSENTLWYVSLRGKPRVLAHDPHASIRDATICPDGTCVAYSRFGNHPYRTLHLVELQTGIDHELGPAGNDDHTPAFSKDGRDLFFLSARRELPIASERDDPSIAALESAGVYTVSLRQNDDGFPHHQAPPSQLTDLSNVLVNAVPVTIPNTGRLTELVAGSRQLFVHSEPVETLSGDDLGGMKNQVIAVDLVSGQSKVVANDAMAIADAHGNGDLAWASTSGIHFLDETGHDGGAFDLHDAAEIRDAYGVDAREVLTQAWRYDRDLFWNHSLENVGWKNQLDRYTPLANRAASHEDVLYVIGELQGEISSSHMFVSGGSDGDGTPKAPKALLGVDFALDRATGRYRLAHIYRGDASRPRLRGPLGTLGDVVHDGDFILAINDVSLRAPLDPYALLPDGDGPFNITVAKDINGATRTIQVLPVHDEHEIRRLDWIARNTSYVEQATAGQVGYIHLRDFSEHGTEDLLRQWNVQAGKNGLIIDIRANEGGSTSQWVLNLLMRRHAGDFVNRQNALAPLPGDPSPKKTVVITNEFSASDGDQFPYYFRRYGLGIVVGERTWGGVRGIDGRIPLIDGTLITVPKDSLVDRENGFILENEGNKPDIAVEDRPLSATGGLDEQLESAVKWLQTR